MDSILFFDNAIELAIIPETYPARELDKNHTPIMKPAILGIDNLVTIDNPTGDKHSSPKV
jgi:hypothetical protein